jgi:hypothetical protein
MISNKSEMSPEMLQDVELYLRQWIDPNGLCDLEVMLNDGDLEMAASELVGAGLLNLDQCHSSVEGIVLVALELASKFHDLTLAEQMQRYKKTFSGCFIAECQDCDHVSFLVGEFENAYPDFKVKCRACDSLKIKAKTPQDHSPSDEDR